MERTDYEEPRCPMDNSMWVKKKVEPIDIGRVITKEDDYLSGNDYAGAKRHLLYWWQEAENGNDDRGRMTLANELMGLYRKLGEGAKAKEYAQKALALTRELELQDTVSGATSFLNAGTVYKAFGEPEKSLEYFERAKAVYEKELPEGNEKIAGLYNNMALTLADLKRYAEAGKYYERALQSTENEAEKAITWLNLADCAVLEKGLEEAEPEVTACLEQAEELLSRVPETDWNGAYAYACEKCAPVFDYYGYFAAAEEFRTRAEKIYRKSR